MTQDFAATTDAVPALPNPFGQVQYQVRFDWGIEGAEAIGAGADVIVWVDVFGGESNPRLSAASDAVIVAGSLRNRAAVARWILEKQGDKGDRFFVAIVAAGEARPNGSVRFALEDQLAAGAIIDALADLGIDYCAPEAAAAAASFTGLRNATGHLIGSAGSGQRYRAAGDADAVAHAIELDSSTEITVIRESTPPA